MKKIMVTLQLKEKVSLLIDVDDTKLNELIDIKKQAKVQALEEFRQCFDSEYYKAFLKHHDFNKSLECIEVPEFINKKG
tara:strand:+ start:271 stop:507 length:237 start_codon:yes stop_codon:yes gene_type:complete